jgi:hydroxymethylpyrimidine pyrophosphatase-like HAD family hydrolase
MNQPTCWIFDIDGVLNDSNLKITPEITAELIKRLEKKDIIALVSGRTADWIIQTVIEPISLHLKDEKLLDQFFAVGEFGAIWATFKNGLIKKEKDNSFSPPPALKEKVKAFIAEFKEYVFLDESKEVIITAEKVVAINYDYYSKGRAVFEQKMRQMLQVEHFSDFTVNTSRHGTNILHKQLNKTTSIKRLLVLFKEKGLSPEKFFVFGDEEADLKMGEGLKIADKEFSFYLVGEHSIIEGKEINFPVSFPTKMFYKGTLEVLKQLD